MAADTPIAGPGILPLSASAPQLASISTVPNDYEPRDFEVLPINELQDFLKRHDLSVDGTQPDLVALCVAKRQELAANSMAAEVQNDEVHPTSANKAAQETVQDVAPPSSGIAPSNTPSLLARIFGR
jgi:hypothetical protein